MSHHGLEKPALDTSDSQPLSTAHWTLRFTPELTWVHHMLSLGEGELRHRDRCSSSRIAKMECYIDGRGFRHLKGQPCACGWMSGQKSCFLEKRIKQMSRRYTYWGKRKKGRENSWVLGSCPQEVWLYLWSFLRYPGSLQYTPLY